eukprot:1233895-Pleurochrysis_carterae.AAC.6
MTAAPNATMGCLQGSAVAKNRLMSTRSSSACAVKLSPLPLLSAVRTMEAAASAGLPQCCNARSTACTRTGRRRSRLRSACQIRVLTSARS